MRSGTPLFTTLVLAVNHWVRGPNPRGGAINRTPSRRADEKINTLRRRTNPPAEQNEASFSSPSAPRSQLTARRQGVWMKKLTRSGATKFNPAEQNEASFS